jgi:hypothetical protein
MFNFSKVAPEIEVAMAMAAPASSVGIDLEAECKARFIALRKASEGDGRAGGAGGGGTSITRSSSGVNGGLTPQAQAAVAAYPRADAHHPAAGPGPAKHLSWDELSARAFAAAADNCRYAPKKLPSFEDPLGPEEEDGDDEENSLPASVASCGGVGAGAGRKQKNGGSVPPSSSSSSAATIKPLSRSDILREIATGKLGNLDDMD